MNRLIITALFVACFTLATWLEPRFMEIRAQSRNSSASILALVLGDSRQMFANHFYAKADAYFHNGNYPSIFDQPAKGPKHMTERGQKEDSHDHAADKDGEDEEALAHKPNAPRDWIERFGRNFSYTDHSHLEKGSEREMLPWIKLSAEMDPHRVDTFVTGAYWLRKRLGKVDQAELFLREGLRTNPDSYEILYQLGSLQDEDRHDATVARNLWKIALEKWHKAEQAGLKPDEMTCSEILIHLALLEARQGNIPQQIVYLEELKQHSPLPGAIDERIQAAKAKMAESRDSVDIKRTKTTQ